MCAIATIETTAILMCLATDHNVMVLSFEYRAWGRIELTGQLSHQYERLAG